MFEASLQEHGHAPHRLIAYDELFQILTSATTRSGKAKVQPDGVVINYLQYSHPDLMKHLGKSLPVRYDPFNLSIAWAQVDATWVQLTSRHASILMNFSEFDVKAVTEAWHRRRSDVKRDRLTDSSLAALLQDAMEQEKALSQAKRDLLAGPSPDACSDRLANDSIEGLPLHDATGVFASDDIDDSSIELCEDF
jgi:putative transposase